MKNYIKEIANYLYINYQHVDSYSLLNGRMGLAVFFYEYSRYRKDESYAAFADYILDEIIDEIDNIPVLYDLYNGISGIAWGIQYLIDRNFVEGSADEILSDFDKKIEAYINQLTSCNINDTAQYFSSNKDVLLSVDFYILSKYKESDSGIRHINTIPEFYQKILNTKKPFHLFFLNSVFAFLYRIQQLDSYKDISSDIYSKLLQSSHKAIESGLYEESDLYLLSKLLNLVGEEEISSPLKKRINQAGINLQDNNNIKNYIRNGWQELIYLNLLQPQHSISDQAIRKYLDKLSCSFDEKDLSLCNGIAGLGLSLIFSSKEPE